VRGGFLTKGSTMFSLIQIISMNINDKEKGGIAREMSPQLPFMLMYCVFGRNYCFFRVSKFASASRTVSCAADGSRRFHPAPNFPV
jgi:hypothetical protein